MFGLKKRRILGREVSTKLTVQLLLLLIIIPNLICGYFYWTIKHDFEIDFGQSLLSLAEIAVSTLDRYGFMQLYNDANDRTKAYQQIQEGLNRLRDSEYVEDIYIYDTQTQSFLDLEKGTFIASRYLKLRDVGPRELAALHSGHSIVTRTYVSRNGSCYKSVYVPVEDKNGVVVAFLGLDGRLEETLALKTIRRWMIACLLTSLGLGIIVFGNVVYPISHTVRNLGSTRRYNQYILQSIKVGIIAIDLEGKITTFNQAARDILGMPDKPVIGHGYEQVLSNQDALVEIMRKTVERRQGCSNHELELQKDTGRMAAVSLNSSLLKDSRDKEIGATIFFSDVTELKELEYQVQLKERLAALGELSAGLAHEIRNPLEGIQVYAELLKGKLSKADDEKLIETIIKEITTLNNIVSNFLAFARFPKPYIQKMKISPLIDNALRLLKPKIERYNIEVKKTLEDSNHYVSIDPKQMEQVFTNLILNAIEAMPEGGKIEITAAVSSPLDSDKKKDLVLGKDYLEICIANNGPFIPEEIQKKIFNPFFTTKEKGTGVGLAIVHRTMEIHQGTIGLESKEGQGTKFILRLPITVKDEDYENTAG